VQVTTDKKLLTIAIPTFNRNAILLKNLERLMPQMEDWVELLIIDNNSKILVSETVKPIIENHPKICSKIFRNAENIGGNANVLRCIEFCETEYIWIVGDDDFPVEDALRKIYMYISKRNAVWVNFYSEDLCQPKRTEKSLHEDLNGFLGELKSISELVFVSTNIYKTAYAKKGLEFGNMFQEMMAPHLISMISGIERSSPTGYYIISKEQLFASISNNDDATTAWPLYKAFMGIMSLYQLPFGNDVATHLLRLVRGTRPMWLNNRNMLSAFSKLSSKYGRVKSFKISSHFAISLLIIDKWKFFLSFPIYIFAILIGPSLYRWKDNYSNKFLQ
jgi:glycosyltransferase involved in cell wall biosynthesis